MGRLVIKLNGGWQSTIDSEDRDRVNQYHWVVAKRSNTNYAQTEISGKKVLLHRFLLGLVHRDGKIVDHINGNGLDNRKCNLRVCTQSENMRNSKPRNGELKGFSYRKDRKKWRVELKLNGKSKYIGLYATKEEAAAAYDHAAIKFYGEFARTNAKTK